MLSFWSMLLVLPVILSLHVDRTVIVLLRPYHGPRFSVVPAPASGTLYTSVEFTCASVAISMRWFINSQSDPYLYRSSTDPDSSFNRLRALSVANSRDNTTGIITSVLTMVALPINDGCEVYCYRNYLESDMFSTMFTHSDLTILGMSPAENVLLDFNSLYWKPPSSVPSKYRPLLSYIVNITIGTNELAVYNTTDTSLKLPVSLVLCDTMIRIPINATVTVTSSGYFSNAVRAKVDYSKYDIPTPLITYNRVTGTFDTTFTISVGHLCDSTTVFGITRASNTDNEQIHQPVYIDKVGGLAHVNYTVSLNGSVNCTFTAIVNDSTGTVRDKRDSPTFTTYHVQNVSVYQVDDSVRVECTFVYQSIADGCHIKLTTDGSIIQSFNISLINESNIASQYITLSVNGIYSITAYDIVNGVITDTPSVQYDEIFQYMSLMDSVTTSDITTAPTSATTSDTTPLSPSESNINE